MILRYEYVVVKVCKHFFFLFFPRETDWKECDLGSSFYTCPAKSTCENVPGSYRCRCELGLAGTGLAGIVKECGGKFLTVNCESPAEKCLNFSFDASVSHEAFFSYCDFL